MKRFLAVCCFLAACWQPAVSAQNTSEGPSSEQSVDLKAIDKSVAPCQDFYQYACGNWVKENPVPPAYARWGRFDDLQNRNLEELRQILDDAAAHQNRSTIDQETGAFYATCMDEAAVNKAGSTPLKPELKRIASLGDKADLAPEVAHLHAQGVNAFFGFGSQPDPDNAKAAIASAGQGGLGLPDKDFYFRTDTKSQQTREEYSKHIARIFVLLGDDASTADQKAKAVMAMETNLASASLNRVERRDPKRTHNKMSLDQFTALFPAFNFKSYLQDEKAPAFEQMNIAEPDFFKNLNKLLESSSLDDLKTYLTWHYASTFAPDLSEPFVNENFSFYGKYLTGAKELQPRWKRCVRSTDANLGEALGQAYVAKAFAGASKEKTQQLVAAIEHQMDVDIDSLTWMSEDTKKQAVAKLHGVTNKIGYPDRWRDYSSIKIVDGDLVGNVRRCVNFEDRRDLEKIGHPVDRSEWGMTPPTVNAYYSPLENNINFPAGILQPPFYSVSRDQAVNFGGIGAVIGHELTHGFDDQGRQFDADGNLRDWWTKQDEAEFKKRADCIANEYQGFSPIPGVNLNGRLTLGENGADNAGVRLALMALTSALENGSIKNEKLEGFTPEQRFFLGYAQLWCENTRPEQALVSAQTNPHSPGRFRVDGVVQNMPEFGKAWGCSAGTPMVAAQGCRVW